MSLYTFATANFTTTDDKSRRPAISGWQIFRAIVFLIVAFIAMSFVALRSHAAEVGFPAWAPAFVEETWS